jgi:hypothetical protein
VEEVDRIAGIEPVAEFGAGDCEHTLGRIDRGGGAARRELLEVELVDAAVALHLFVGTGERHAGGSLGGGQSGAQIGGRDGADGFGGERRHVEILLAG